MACGAPWQRLFRTHAQERFGPHGGADAPPEPLLAAVELKPEWLPRPGVSDPAVDWVMAGGESGPSARMIQLDWVRALRDQCARTGTPFYWNDWGAAAPDGQAGKGAAPETAHRRIDGVLHEGFPPRA